MWRNICSYPQYSRISGEAQIGLQWAEIVRPQARDPESQVHQGCHSDYRDSEPPPTAEPWDEEAVDRADGRECSHLDRILLHSRQLLVSVVDAAHRLGANGLV